MIKKIKVKKPYEAPKIVDEGQLKDISLDVLNKVGEIPQKLEKA